MKAWDITQKRQLEDHKKGIRVFADESSKSAIMVGEYLDQLIPKGVCLDVGCGILPLPGYMKAAPSVRFTGIDPYEGGQRDFFFIRGRAEQLPFPEESFDAVLFATSIDHVADPTMAIAEANRVLKYDGYLVIWGSFRNENDLKYKSWLQTRSVKIYNHPWAFTCDSIHKLLYKYFDLRKKINIINSEKILIYQK